MNNEYVTFGDIVEANGKTIRQNNLSKKHSLPLGTLVEAEVSVEMAKGTYLTGKAKFYIFTHDRDCDGTPLYGIASDSWEGLADCFQKTPEEMRSIMHGDRIVWNRIMGAFNIKYFHGYSEDILTVIE